MDGGIINLPFGRDLLPYIVFHLIQRKRLPVGNRLAGIVFPAQIEPEIHASAANAHNLKAYALGIASRVKNAKQLVLRKMWPRLLLTAVICHRCKCTCGDGNQRKNDHPYHGNLSFHHGAPSFLFFVLFFLRFSRNTAAPTAASTAVSTMINSVGIRYKLDHFGG